MTPMFCQNLSSSGIAYWKRAAWTKYVGQSQGRSPRRPQYDPFLEPILGGEGGARGIGVVVEGVEVRLGGVADEGGDVGVKSRKIKRNMQGIEKARKFGARTKSTRNKMRTTKESTTKGRNRPVGALAKGRRSSRRSV